MTYVNRAISLPRHCGIVPYHKEDEIWDGELWIGLRKLDFEHKVFGPFSAPIGRVFDLGSVPDICKGLVDDSDESLLSFAGHDELCIKDSIASKHPDGRALNDEFLYDVCLQQHQTWWRSFKSRLGVWFGDVFVDYFTEEGVQDLEFVREFLAQANEDLVLAERGW